MDKLEFMETDDTTKVDDVNKKPLDLNENLELITRISEHELAYASSTSSCSCDDHDNDDAESHGRNPKEPSKVTIDNNRDNNAVERRDHGRNQRRTVFSSASSSGRSGGESPIPLTRKLNSVLVKPHRCEEVRMEREREARLESQRSDTQAMARNKRMFGMLMGTLKRFKTEETNREEKMVQRSQIEEKLEQKVEPVEYKSSGSSIPKSRNDNNDYETRLRDSTPERRPVSYRDRRRTDSGEHEELDRSVTEREDKAGRKLDVMGRFRNWERTHKHLCGFIQTETKPKIFWLPKEHNLFTERRLRETKDYFGLCIAERTAKYKSEINELNQDDTNESK